MFLFSLLLFCLFPLPNFWEINRAGGQSWIPRKYAIWTVLLSRTRSRDASSPKEGCQQYQHKPNHVFLILNRYSSSSPFSLPKFSSPPNELDFIGTVRYFVRPSQEDQQDHLQEAYCHPHHQIQSGLLRGVWHSVMRPEEWNGLRKSGLTRTHSASLGLYCAPLPPFVSKTIPLLFIMVCFLISNTFPCFHSREEQNVWH